ncbi:MAG: hypothetical protein JXA89_11300 [Anaerolineae bacterium]|nr:hypothetical protein [Anaerolineae bacterium]
MSPTPLPTTLATSTAATPAPKLPTATHLPLPSPTVTATPAHTWQYWPNAVDFRDIAVDEDGTLWIAALSGLVQYNPPLDRWQVWTTADGLVNNNGVSVVLWRGAVWVGTQGGISRFVPSTGTWHSYTLEHGLPGLRNTHLYLDGYANTLWAGTSDGLARFDPGLDRWVTENSAATSFAGTQQFYADKDFLWIGVTHNDASRGGLVRLEKATGKWQDIHHTPGAPPRDSYALAASESHLWAVNTSGNVYEHDLRTGDWRQMTELPNRIDTSFMHPVYHTPELWLASPSRFIRYNVETGQLSRMPYPQIPFFVQNHPVFAGSIAWVPAQSGLYTWENAKWIHYRPTTFPAAINAAYAAGNAFAADKGALILITAYGPGYLLPSTGNWQPFHPVKAKVQPSMVTTHLSAPGDAWAYAPQTQTLWHYARADVESERLDIGSDFSLYQLLPYFSDEALWFETRNALLKFDLHAHQQRTYLLPATTFIEGTTQEPGAIWTIKDGKTLARLDTQSEQFSLYPIPFGANWQHVAPAKNAIWIGGESNQLLSVDRNGRHWQRTDLNPICVGTIVYALSADDQAVWAAGKNGVVRYDLETKQQTCYTTERGMLNDQAEQIILMDNWVWFTHRWYGLWGVRLQNEEGK